MVTVVRKGRYEGVVTVKSISPWYKDFYLTTTFEFGLFFTIQQTKAAIKQMKDEWKKEGAIVSIYIRDTMTGERINVK